MKKFPENSLPIISDWSWIQKLTLEEKSNGEVYMDPRFNLEGDAGSRSRLAAASASTATGSQRGTTPNLVC